MAEAAELVAGASCLPIEDAAEQERLACQVALGEAGEHRRAQLSAAHAEHECNEAVSRCRARLNALSTQRKNNLAEAAVCGHKAAQLFQKADEVRNEGGAAARKLMHVVDQTHTEELVIRACAMEEAALAVRTIQLSRRNAEKGADSTLRHRLEADAQCKSLENSIGHLAAEIARMEQENDTLQESIANLNSYCCTLNRRLGRG